MESHNNDILDDIMDAAHALLDAEDQVVRLKARLAEEVARLRLLPVGDERDDAARHLYWYARSIPVNDIAMGYQGCRKNKAFDAMIAAKPPLYKCANCQQPIELRSRTALAAIEQACKDANQTPPNGHNWLCNRCQAKADQRRSAAWEEAMQKRNARENQLAAMPYAEYLLTPDWAEKREHLTHIVMFSRYNSFWAEEGEVPSCELCNERSGVSIRHKANAPQGWEDASDVMMLCQSCGRDLTQLNKLKPLPES